MTNEKLNVLVAVVDLRDEAHDLRDAAADGAHAYQDLTRDLSAIASHLLDDYLDELDPATRNIVEATYRVRAEIVEVAP